MEKDLLDCHFSGSIRSSPARSGRDVSLLSFLPDPRHNPLQRLPTHGSPRGAVAWATAPGVTHSILRERKEEGDSITTILPSGAWVAS